MEIVREATVTDDRGVVHPAAKFQGDGCPDPNDPRVRAMFARLRSRMAATPRRISEAGGHFLGPAVMVAIAIGTTLAINRFALIPKRLGPIVVAIAVASVVLGIAAMRRRAGRLALGDISGELLSIGRCPACAYALASAPRSEGMVTCSECGAAWREERVAAVDVASAPPTRQIRFAQILALSYVRLPSMPDANGTPQVVFGLIEPSFGSTEGVHEGIKRMQKRRLWRTVGVLLLLIGITAALLYIAIVPVLSFELLLLCVIVGLAVMARFGIRHFTGRHRAYRLGLLGLRVCPACANALRDEPGDRAACAACGAVWSVVDAPKDAACA
jgi:hypothetical protein